MIKVCKFETFDELSEWAADFVCSTAVKEIQAKGFFTIALSGGSSPAKLYSLLSSSKYSGKLNWGKTYIFWSDERFVDRYDDDSNYKMAYELLISKANIRMSQIFAVPVSGLTPTESALLYERQISNLFKEKKSLQLF